MLVFGDPERVERVDRKRSCVRAALEAAQGESRGLERHAALVRAFIELSELFQGLADAEHATRGCDDRTPLQEAGMALLVEVARAVERSWRSGFQDARDILPGSLARLEALGAPQQTLQTKTAEGYAFYALYPESYLAAAARSGLGPDTRLIGIRSIGAGLAALVAAALDAKPPVTVRPTGHPFRRKVSVGPTLTAELAADRDAPYAIVDEGPGLSGSSFGAVADWLEACGIAPHRIHVFPSHGGDLGSQASALHRERWAAVRRHCADVDDWLIRSPNPAHRLETWLADRVGPLDGPVEDLSGGRWRELLHPPGSDWPPSNTQQERRKFFARAGGELWLAKFAGLGVAGTRKLATAKRLQDGGFVPEAVGLCHGFLVQRFVPARPLDLHAFDRRRLIERVGAYLGFRARHLEASDAMGASLPALARMTVHNTRHALGDVAAAALEGRLQGAVHLDGCVRRVDTDNRLHLWEWLATEDGRLLKADALDHSTAHDLVGCQDVAWDVAGAGFELDLTGDEQADLCALVGQAAGRSVDADLVAFLRPCYLAFQLGAWTLAAEAVGGAEVGRVRQTAQSYRARLDIWLATASAAPHRQDSAAPA